MYDNLVVELDRLAALAGLLEAAEDRFDPGLLGGVGALLGDIEERMREVLRYGPAG